MGRISFEFDFPDTTPNAWDIASRLRMQANLICGEDPQEKTQASSLVMDMEPAADAAPKAKRGRPAKTEKEAKKEDPAREVDELFGDEPEGKPEVTREQIVDALRGYADKAGDRNAAIALLKKYDKSGSVNKVPKEKYAELLATIQGLEELV